MYKDARTKNPILAKFLHETHYEENDDEGEWYMTDDNWRYFKEFVAGMSDIEAAEAQVEKDGVAEIIREYVSDYDVIAFAKREPYRFRVKEPQPKAFDTEIDVGFNDPPGFSGRALFGFTYTNRSPYQLPLTAGFDTCSLDCL
jgi:hypothetical protein